MPAWCIVPAGEKLHLHALGKRAEMAPTDRRGSRSSWRRAISSS
jgi:hypothetical protein